MDRGSPGASMSSVPHEEAGDVVLRDVIESDLPTFYEHQADPTACAMAAFTPRDRDAFMAHWAKILKNDASPKKTVLFRGEVAGNIVAWDQDGRRLVGYWIGTTLWRRGIATRALAQFLDQVTERPLYAFVALHNPASIRVLEKCGFTQVRRLVAEDGFEELEMELRAAEPR